MKLTSLEKGFIESQDGLQHETIEVALPKMQARIEMMDYLPNSKILLLKEFGEMLDSGMSFRECRETAKSAYVKLVKLSKHRNKLDNVSILIHDGTKYKENKEG